MHIFSQNNYENGSKKTFAIISKSAKFVKVFFRERFPVYGITLGMVISSKQQLVAAKTETNILHPKCKQHVAFQA